LPQVRRLLKSIIFYFSQTGNTRKVAQAIHKGMSQVVEQCDIARIRDIARNRDMLDTLDLPKYDLIGVGSVVWARMPLNLRLFINSLPYLKGKHAFTFCTHACLMDGRFIPRVARLLAKRGLTVIGTGDWYGDTNLPMHPKPCLTDGHPDQIDLMEAEQFGKEMVQFSRRISAGETELIPPLPPAVRLLKKNPLPKPKFNMQKCLYPKCQLCMDYCPVNAIDLSASPQVLVKDCRPCFFCEKICPTGAIEFDYETGAKRTILRVKRDDKDLDKAEAEGRFRRLVPKENIGWNTPYEKVYSKHPRYVIPEEDRLS
jgi:Fe-S-cluster-containing hydrogenase component 2/flavodoxin